MVYIDKKYKTCSRCGKNLEATAEYFYKNITAKDGLFPYCKECNKKKTIEWRIENPEKNKVLYDRWNNKPKQKERMKLASKRQKQEGYLKQYQQENKDKISHYNKNKRENHTHEISDAEWDNCKIYFNCRCAYCGLKIEDHYITYAGKLKWTDFHQEHVDDGGANDLSNCIPSCKSCNSQKWEYGFEEWYKEGNPVFDENRKNIIQKWLDEDFKLYKEIQ